MRVHCEECGVWGLGFVVWGLGFYLDKPTAISFVDDQHTATAAVADDDDDDDADIVARGLHPSSQS